MRRNLRNAVLWLAWTLDRRARPPMYVRALDVLAGWLALLAFAVLVAGCSCDARDCKLGDDVDEWDCPDGATYPSDLCRLRDIDAGPDCVMFIDAGP